MVIRMSLLGILSVDRVISTSISICICVFKDRVFILIHPIPVEQHRIHESFPSSLIYNSFLQQ